MKTKEPGIAGALNIFPGLGYLYIDRGRPLGWMLVISSVLTIVGMFEPSSLEYMMTPVTPIWELVYTVTFLVFFAAFIVDGYQEAKRHNKSLKSKPAKK